jgi:hypothetical protein
MGVNKGKIDFIQQNQMILGFHGGDYEDYRILVHKNPVLTSQEPLYISATQPNHLNLCEI